MLVKICGITNRDDAMAAVEAGAGAIGLNFYRESPRYISPTGAAMVAAKVPAGVLKVGVFVDETREAIAKIAVQAGLDVAQLHGVSECESLPVWRACGIRDATDIAGLWADHAEALLLDTASSSLHGGTGLTFPWSLAREARQFTAKKIIIAGGLDETNVQTAIEEAEPWGVDACSRLEAAPGVKDHQKMKKFIEAALGMGR